MLSVCAKIKDFIHFFENPKNLKTNIKFLFGGEMEDLSAKKTPFSPPIILSHTILVKIPYFLQK